MLLRRSIRLTQKTVPSRREYARWAIVSWSLCTMWLEDRVLLSAARPALRQRALLLPASVMNSAVPITIGSPASGNLTAGRSRFLRDPAGLGRSIDRADPGRFQLARSSGSRSTTARATCWSRATASRPAARPPDRSACRRGGRLPRGAEPLRLGNLLAFDVIDPVVRPGSNAPLPQL